jgi:hypothetical protein
MLTALGTGVNIDQFYVCFLDLVEKGIHYLPLFPDDSDNTFQQEFFRDTPNALISVIPEAKNQEAHIKLIDVNGVGNGRSLNLRMNARKNYALAYFAHAT